MYGAESSEGNQWYSSVFAIDRIKNLLKETKNLASVSGNVMFMCHIHYAHADTYPLYSLVKNDFIDTYYKKQMHLEKQLLDFDSYGQCPSGKNSPIAVHVGFVLTTK